jgi:peptidyl-prolyl cis-trans isomerase SurA
MAPTDSITSISTGTGADADNELAEKSGPQKKTRFASRESETELSDARTKLAKAEVKATTRPVAATPTQSASEKVQSAPLGLNGDTTKKPKKPKRKKGEAKQRMQEQQKPAETPTPVDPTVNPDLAKPAVTPSAP